MNIKRAKEEIKNTIEAYLLKDEWGEYVIPSIRQRPVLLVGPPGVGKTQIMEQIARECRIGLVAYTITHHTRQSAVGLPFIEKKVYGGREYSVTEYTMSEIVASVYNRMEETGLSEGILFLDEINCVSETLAPAMLQFLQCKTFGTHRLPEGWILVAAGNPPEYNKSVREFDVVTLDRVKRIDVEPDLGVWKEYAKDRAIHPAILSYLGVKPGNFCRVEADVDGKRFVTPRGWEDLSQFLQVYERLGKKPDREVIVQYIQHPGISKEFANYLELYYKYQDAYRVEEILEGRFDENLCDKAASAPFDECMGITGMLLAGLENGFGRHRQHGRVMELLTEKLRDCRRMLLGDAGQSAQAVKAGASEAGQPQIKLKNTEAWEILEEQAAEIRALRENDKKRGLLTRAQDHVFRRGEETLSAWADELRLTGTRDREEAWQVLRERFMEESDRYEEEKAENASRLEHAFDFMEAAFAAGQAMVIFVTELNTSRGALEFLNEYECERYYLYNKELLFDEQEQEIKSRIAKTRSGPFGVEPQGPKRKV